jgi:UDP-N-acetylmuramate dehydrogenase
VQILEHHPLRALNTFGFEVRGRYFGQAESVEDLRAGLAFAGRRGLALLVLGGGSNLILRGDWPGLVLRPLLGGLEAVREEGPWVWLRAQAGEDWDGLVRASLERGLGGLENLSGIPGTVGAAPVQNIGAYGVELAECFDHLEALERDSGRILRLGAEDCRFGYRTSSFKAELAERLVITAVTFRLRRNAPPRTTYAALADELRARGLEAPTLLQVREAVLAVRARKIPEPAVLGNAGSFFQNPVVERAIFDGLRAQEPGLPGFPEPDGRVKLSAGWLVERCGFKGLRRGAVGVHAAQANILVNHGGAAGADILALAEEIRAAARAAFGLELSIEPRIV